ncbi:MAG TPA: class I SAM-dependent methyltransferase [Candidatus Eisenbacteria bacterium]|nr:class I SAM-dependent methyltransferase [Candidatus Eisenbacteria bacterium]
MVNYVGINKKWWNTITPIHEKSSLYNLTQFKKGRTSLQEIEIKELGNVKGKKLLHLMCHFGMDTLSWARKGAYVTGVDISDESIKTAKKLSEEIKIPATFICSDIYKLEKVLHEKFDIIFMSYGVLLWLSHIKKWAKIIELFLKKGGIFYIVELHPFTTMLSYNFKLSYDYFDKGPYLDDADGSYTNWDEKIKGVTYEWSYTMSDVLNALQEAGLKIEYLHEFPFTMYNQFPGLMKKNTKGQYVLKDSKVQVPLLFSLKASK